MIIILVLCLIIRRVAGFVRNGENKYIILVGRPIYGYLRKLRGEI
jgi:hypothetical protein